MKLLSDFYVWVERICLCKQGGRINSVIVNRGSTIVLATVLLPIILNHFLRSSRPRSACSEASWDKEIYPSQKIDHVTFLSMSCISNVS